MPSEETLFYLFRVFLCPSSVMLTWKSLTYLLMVWAFFLHQAFNHNGFNYCWQSIVIITWPCALQTDLSQNHVWWEQDWAAFPGVLSCPAVKKAGNHLRSEQGSAAQVRAQNPHHLWELLPLCRCPGLSRSGGSKLDMSAHNTIKPSGQLGTNLQILLDISDLWRDIHFDKTQDLVLDNIKSRI